jgi:hypothetical protein
MLRTPSLSRESRLSLIDMGRRPLSWDQWDQSPRFDAAFDTAGLNDEQRASMRQALLHERHLGLRQRFASYVCDRLPASWWTITVQDYLPSLELQPDGSAKFTGQTPGETWSIDRFVPQDNALLRRRLLATYDARSSYVHVGRRAGFIGRPAGVCRGLGRAQWRPPSTLSDTAPSSAALGT